MAKIYRIFIFTLIIQFVFLLSVDRGTADDRNSNQLVTEGGFDPNCGCVKSTSPIAEKNIGQLKQIPEEYWHPAYYYKFKIDEYMREIVAKAPQHQSAVEENLHALLPTLKVKDQERILELNKNVEKLSGDVSLSLSEVLRNVAKSVPGVQALTDEFILKLNVEGQAGSEGGQVGKTRSIQVEKRPNSQDDQKYSLKYSSCSEATEFKVYGNKTECSYKDSTEGTYQKKIFDGVYLGGAFSATRDKSHIMPEGGVYLEITY